MILVAGFALLPPSLYPEPYTRQGISGSCRSCGKGRSEPWSHRGALDAHPVAEYKNSIVAASDRIAGDHIHARVRERTGVKDGQGEVWEDGADAMLHLWRGHG